MRKFVRLALTCAVLAAAMFAPASAVPPARAEEPTYSVTIIMSPSEVVCIGDPVPILISYQWGQTDDDIHKHVPIKGGKLSARGMVGTVQPASYSATRTPGNEIFTYTGNSFGREQLLAFLKSPAGTLATSLPAQFDVRECNYQMTIDAKVIISTQGVKITTLIKAKGKIYVTELEAKGTLPMELGFEAQGEDPATECKVVPEVKALSSVDVDGARSTSFLGNDILDLTFSYYNFEQIPRANIKCEDKTKHYKIKEFPLPVPSKYNPKTDLPPTVKIKNWEPVTMPLGKAGSVTFKVTKVTGSGGKQ